MKKNQKKYGFSIVELLITMFVAAIFLMAGYQLYSLIIKDSGETAMQTKASNLAYDYLQKYKPIATSPCTDQAPLVDQAIDVDGLYNVKVSAIIDCPYGTSSTISRVKVDLKYGDKSPQQIINNATYVNQKLTCPTGYIVVPGSQTYGTNDFCVMKYEAKNDGNNNAISVADGLPWANITRFGNSTNVSQGATATSSILTDGDTSNTYSLTGLGSVTVDLGSTKDINSVKIWHGGIGLTYFNTKTEISTDNTNWTTIFDSATDGLYKENIAGKTISFNTKKVRFIRDWANGSSGVSAWAEIQAFSPIDAGSKSVAACAGCHLITEAEWMTIAQNVLSVASNWSGGAVGSGFIYSGHNDNSPANSLAASTDDNDGYFGTDNTAGNQKRTLTLTNGETIWDFAGNVWEWTAGQTTGNQPGITSELAFAWKDWAALTVSGNLSVNPFLNNINITGSNTWTADTNSIGKLYSYISDSSLRGFLRGGSWCDHYNAGVLALYLGLSPSNTDANIGFRVAK